MAKQSETAKQSDAARIIGKIPVFHDLPPVIITKLLNISITENYSKTQQVYAEGGQIDGMGIIISGQLVVEGKGNQLATLLPGDTVGEMGVFTGFKRSATVRATEDTVLLNLERDRLNEVLKQDPRIQTIVQANIIRILAHRIMTSNISLREHMEILAKEKRQKQSK